MNCMKIMDENVDVCPHCGYGQKAEAVSFRLRPGTILRGRYLVGRVLGQGGFGLTYVGFDLTLEIKIAVKEYFPSDSVTRNNTVSKQVQWNTVQMDRNKWQAGCEGFLKEARRMAKLDALPGIVHVRDTFSENQTAYIIMDYIEGETLKQRLMKTGPMKYAECMEMLRPLMESLGKMHGYGLVHRDISPDNIMVQPDGSVCLLDFGAAKDISLQNAASQQIAKKGFSPPEQYREKGSIGPWTDVYALCATIYYCITGKMVPDALERMYEDTLVVNAPFLDFGDETVAQTLADGLKLRAEERIQTVEEFLARLTRPSIPPVPPEPSIPPISPDPPISPEPPIPPIPPEPPIPPKPKKKPVWIAAVAAAGLLALVLVIRAVLGLDKKETEIIQPVIGGDTAEEMPEEKKTEEAEGQKQDAAFAESIGEATADAQEEQSAYANMLMRETALTDGGDGFWYGTVLGSEISRDSIATVTFVDTLDKMPDTAWDVSWMQDGSVMAWTQESSVMMWTHENEMRDDLLDLFIGAEGAVKGLDCATLFASYHNVVKIDFQSSFDTSQAIRMYRMFGECGNLKELDLSGIETGNVENMCGMFNGCTGMTELDLSGFDTRNVEDMGYMFCGCNALVSLDLSGFDTRNVEDMRYMFLGCMALGSLDLSSFDTGNVKDMGSMFRTCIALASLDLSSFDTGNVENMDMMFAGCEALGSLDLSSFDTGNVENMNAMFGACRSLGSLDLSGFDTGNVEDMELMFVECEALGSLDLSGFDTRNVEYMGSMFAGCTSLVSLDLSSFDTGSVIDDMDTMFTDCGVTAEEAGLKTN